VLRYISSNTKLELLELISLTLMSIILKPNFVTGNTKRKTIPNHLDVLKTVVVKDIKLSKYADQRVLKKKA